MEEKGRILSAADGSRHVRAGFGEDGRSGFTMISDAEMGEYQRQESEQRFANKLAIAFKKLKFVRC